MMFYDAISFFHFNMVRLYRHLKAKFTGETFISTSCNDHYITPDVDKHTYSTWKKGEVFHPRVPDGLGFITVVDKDFNPFTDSKVRVMHINTQDGFCEDNETDEIHPHKFSACYRRDSNNLVLVKIKTKHKPPTLKEL